MDIKEIDVKPLDIIKTLMSLIPKELLPVIQQSYNKVVYDLLIGLESNLIGKTFKVKKLQSLNYVLIYDLNDYDNSFSCVGTINKYYYYKDNYSKFKDIWLFDSNGEEAVVVALTNEHIELELKTNKTIKIWKTLK